METLPSVLLGNICSNLSDNTLFNLSISSQSFSTALNASKDIINWNKLDNDKKSFNFDDKYKCENDKVSCMDFYGYIVNNIGYMTYNELFKNVKSSKFTIQRNFDMLMSVKVKGTCESIKLTIFGYDIYEINTSFIKALPVDDDGYVEIYSWIKQYSAFVNTAYVETRFAINHSSNIDVKVTGIFLTNSDRKYISNMTDYKQNICVPSNICNFVSNQRIIDVEINNIKYKNGGFLLFLSNKYDKPINIDIVKHVELIIDYMHSYKAKATRLHNNLHNKHNLPCDMKNCLYYPTMGIDFRKIKNIIMRIEFERIADVTIELYHFHYRLMTYTRNTCIPETFL